MELQELHSYIQEHQPNTCQISVLQDGNEIYSAEWNGYQRTVCLHILSGILFKATGMKTVDFANEYLFRPLGIAEHKNAYARTAQEHMLFITDKTPRKNVWLADPQGLGTPSYGLCLSAADMAKLGQLCLQNGTWNGQKIISSEWLKEMLSPRRIESGTFSGMSYGYLWWIVHPERNISAAIGDSGNVIYVDPNEKVVAAASAYFKPAVHDRIDFIENILLPTINKALYSENTSELLRTS